jgi:uncharacterized protein YceH (UPF0502 family)
MESLNLLLVLNPLEIRVLGSLIEKDKTTPDYYPMTLNSLILACNQKSSRNPVVQYDDETVLMTLDTLKKKGLISTATGGTSRSIKYKHNFTLLFSLTTAELAVICLLFLRGSLTAGEVKSNSSRLYEFESLDEVYLTLDKLMSSEKRFLKQLPKQLGQKEARYIHLLGEFIEIPLDNTHEPSAHTSLDILEERLAIVEQQLSELKLSVDFFLNSNK